MLNIISMLYIYNINYASNIIVPYIIYVFVTPSMHNLCCMAFAALDTILVGVKIEDIPFMIYGESYTTLYKWI